MRRAFLALTALMVVLVCLPTRGAAGQTIQVTQASQLKLPPSAFPPDMTITVNTSMDAASATTQTLQGLTHTGTYTSLGMLGGWYQEANRSLPSNGGTYFLTYLGSYYRDSDAATGAFNDAATGWASLVPVLCQTFAKNCAEVTLNLTVNNLPYRGTFRMMQVSNALFEGGFLYPVDRFTAGRTQGTAELDALTQAFIRLLSTPPTPLPPTNTPVAPATATAAPTATTQPTPVPIPTATPVLPTPVSVPTVAPVPSPTATVAPTAIPTARPPTAVPASKPLSLALSQVVAVNAQKQVQTHFRRGQKLQTQVTYVVSNARGTETLKMRQAFEYFSLGRNKWLSGNSPLVQDQDASNGKHTVRIGYTVPTSLAFDFTQIRVTIRLTMKKLVREKSTVIQVDA